MNLVTIEHLTKSYTERLLFDDTAFSINEGEKVGLIGINGTGKSTLLKIVAGLEEPDDGSVVRTRNLYIRYLPQIPEFTQGDTVLESIMRDNENETHYSSREEMSATAKSMLNELGIRDHDARVETLSGGQRKRVALAGVLMSRAELLILDEPTNHLDSAMADWLEDYLKNFRGALLMITHDRYFLDKIVTKVVEIENRKSTVYNGNYTAYMNQKAINRDIQQKAYENQQRELKRQEEVIRTLKAFNREKSIKRAESREKQLEKIERIDRPDSLPSHMRLTLTPRIISGTDVLHAEELSKSYGGQRIFRHVNLDIKRGETVAIIGPNGVGKSTLFKMLLGEVPSDSGLMRFGTNVHVGYYDQEQQKLDSNKTIFDEISDTYPTLTAGEIRNMLAAFVFTEDDVFKQVSSLSGGEKGRVSLAKIMLSKANLLMLDEPTNHLDMFSKEVLEDALNRYEGTVVYISHDRYFINKTAQIILELSPEGITRYEGNYDYYMEKKAERARKEALLAAEQPVKGAAPTPVQTMTDTKSDWLKQKEQQAAERKLAAKIAKVEKAIEETEAAIAKADEDMAAASSDYAKAQEIFEEKTKLEEKLEGLYEEWEGLHA